MITTTTIGNVCALSGRDCSTQRRFQKIFEEGPPQIQDDDIFYEMQLCACRLVKAIGYVGAGTVEYLYNPTTKEFCFLELNPRLQVEHPVTENITGVNLLQQQVQIGMGCPLYAVTDIREFFSDENRTKSLKNRKPIAKANPTGSFDSLPSTNPLPNILETEAGEAAFDPKLNHGTENLADLDLSPKYTSEMKKHCIQQRITAENPEDEFMPCSGGIQKIEFQPTYNDPVVWGYFQVQCPGQVHEFADSQFGHTFSVGKNREECRRGLNHQLSQITIEGDVRTTVIVLSKLINSERFVSNLVDTSWLDGLIKSGVIKRWTQEVPDSGMQVNPLRAMHS